MANTLQVTHLTGATLYFHIRNEDGEVWNGTSFGAYLAINWLDYDLILTEQGASSVYTATFPSVPAGDYAVTVYKQDGVGPLETDYVLGNMLVPWSGTGIVSLEDCSDTSAAAAILSNPANKIATVGTGEVTTNNVGAIASATATSVWGSGSRTLTSFGTLIADIWAYATRTLTNFVFDTTNSTLEGRLSDARATKLDNLDAAVTTRASATNQTAIKAVTDKLDDTLEDDGGTQRFTLNALEQGPDSVSDATLAQQTAILAAIAALNNVTASEVATAVLGATVDGAIDLQTAMKLVFASQHGKMVRTSLDPLTFQYYADDDSTVVMTVVIPTTGASRTVT